MVMTHKERYTCKIYIIAIHVGATVASAFIRIYINIYIEWKCTHFICYINVDYDEFLLDMHLFIKLTMILRSFGELLFSRAIIWHLLKTFYAWQYVFHTPRHTHMHTYTWHVIESILRLRSIDIFNLFFYYNE